MTPSEAMLIFLLYLALLVCLFGAWVSGTLDPYQKKCQEIILDAMGETKVSYGLKSMLINPNTKQLESLLLTGS